jgi:hypothetical protein
MNSHAFNQTITTPTASATRFLRTPWPIVVGQILLSLLITLVGFRKQTKKPGASTTVSDSIDWILWAFNFARVVGTTTFLIVAAASKQWFVPPIGAAILCGNLVISNGSYRVPARAKSFVVTLKVISGIACSVCMVLYIVNGAAAFVTKAENMIRVMVNTGCADVNPSVLSGHCYTVENMKEILTSTKGDLILTVAWYIGVLFIGPLTIAGALFDVGGLDEYDDNDNDDCFGSTKNLIKFVIIIVPLAVGGSLDIVAAVMGSWEYTASFYNCNGATRLPVGFDWGPCKTDSVVFNGSSSGFFQDWARDRESVARSVFVW